MNRFEVEEELLKKLLCGSALKGQPGSGADVWTSLWKKLDK